MPVNAIHHIVFVAACNNICCHARIHRAVRCIYAAFLCASLSMLSERGRMYRFPERHQWHLITAMLSFGSHKLQAHLEETGPRNRPPTARRPCIIALQIDQGCIRDLFCSVTIFGQKSPSISSSFLPLLKGDAEYLLCSRWAG